MLSTILTTKGLTPAAIRVAAWWLGCMAARPVRLRIEALAAGAGCDKRSAVKALDQIGRCLNIEIRYDLASGIVEFPAQAGAEIDPPETDRADEPIGFVKSRDDVMVWDVEAEREAEVQREQAHREGRYSDCIQMSLFTDQPASVRTSIPVTPAAQRRRKPCATPAQAVRKPCAPAAPAAPAEPDPANPFSDQFAAIRRALIERGSLPAAPPAAPAEPPAEPAAPPADSPAEPPAASRACACAEKHPPRINNIINNQLNIKPKDNSPTTPNPELIPSIDAGAIAAAVQCDQGKRFDPQRKAEYERELKRKFPEIFTPDSEGKDHMGWARYRLCSMMGWGAPESVFAGVIASVTDRTPENRPRQPKALFASLVKNLETQYQWRTNR